MSTNLHAALRYAIIDKCLRDHTRIYRWKDISQRCFDEMIEVYPDFRAPSRRQVYYDLENMKSGKLGYTAPIEASRARGIYYYDRSFSIFRLSLTPGQAADISHAINLLSQMLKNARLQTIRSTLEVLREKINVSLYDGAQHVYFEESLNDLGIKWVDQLFNACKSKTALAIRYEPFNKPAENIYLSPYFIKEYNNRWYIIGYNDELRKVINLSCDRILEIRNSIRPFLPPEEGLHEKLYQNVYGITILENESVQEIRFRAKPLLSRYLITKPIHSSQKILSSDEAGTVFSLQLAINYEIVQKFLGYGADAYILQPKELADRIKQHLVEILPYYTH
jgi:predicted DNA-binding transcriptional regulator YafY